jgi:hypothetical protein
MEPGRFAIAAGPAPVLKGGFARRNLTPADICRSISVLHLSG